MNTADDWAKFAVDSEEIDRLRREREIVIRQILQHGPPRKLSDLEWFDKPAKPKQHPVSRKPAVPMERYVVRRLELSRRDWMQ